MPDFLANVYRQRQMAAQERYRQMEYQRHMLQQRALEEQRMRQAQQQQGVQQRIMGQNDFGNQLRIMEMNQRAEEARRRDAEQAKRDELRQLQAERGPLRPGWRWKGPQSREQELIPNGPAWTQMQQQHAKDLEALLTINNGVERFIGRLGNVMKPSNKGGFEGNFGMIPEVLTRYLPGENYDTKVQLDQLENMAKTSELRGIRDTGGAIGSITEKEWPLIASRLQEFSVGMTDKAARDMFGVSRRELLNMRNRELQSYRNKWKGTPFYQETPTPIPAMDEKTGIPKTFGYGEDVWKHLTDEERNLWLPGMSKD